MEQVCNSLKKQDDEMELDVGLVFHFFRADAANLAQAHTYMPHTAQGWVRPVLSQGQRTGPVTTRKNSMEVYDM